MSTVSFYVDSFGRGHITRQCALVRALKKRTKVIFNCAGYLDELEKMLPDAQVRKADFGLKIVPKGLGVDLERTRELNASLRRDLEARVDAVTADLKATRPDLIVADIPAEVFLAAERLGIPVFAVSNFGWNIILDEIFGKGSEEGKMYSEAYSTATKTLVLPFNEPMSSFRNRQKVGLLRRRLTKRMRKSKKVLCFLGPDFGRALNIDRRNFWALPPDYYEGQDYVASSRAVFSKPAYGVCSEAVANGIPMFLKKRSNFCESEYILKALKGVKMVPEDTDPFSWILGQMEDVNWVTLRKIKEKYLVNSDEEIASMILAHLGEK